MGKDDEKYVTYERGFGHPLGPINTFKHAFGLAGKSGYGSKTVAHDVVRGWDGAGKVALVTGPFTGVGLETCRALASSGCEIIMAGRDATNRGVQVVSLAIMSVCPDARVTCMELDLSSLASVKRFAEEFLALNKPLHILVNNAGIMATPFTLSSDGFELQFATNHLGHFLLTQLLLERIKQTAATKGAPQGRIINLSSGGHFLTYPEASLLDEDMLKSNAKYDKWGAYGQTKLCNVLYARELNDRLEKEGANVVAVAVMPGVICTPLFKHVQAMGSSSQELFFLSISFIAKSVPQGAATTVYCATAQDIVGGQYYANANLSNSSAASKKRRLGRRLYELSTKYCSEYWCKQSDGI